MNTGQFYDHTSYPATGAAGSSAALRAELDAIEAGFNKLPSLSGNAGRYVKVAPGATDLETTSVLSDDGTNATVSGNLTVSGGAIGASNSQRHALPAVAADTFALLAAAQTLTSKTINLTNNTLSGTLAQFNTAVTDDDFAGLAAAQTLTSKSINLANNTLTGTLAQFNTAVTDDDFAGLAAAQTLTSKTINLTNNTLSGTKAQFSTACSDGDFLYVGDVSGPAVATQAEAEAGVEDTKTMTPLKVKQSIVANVFTSGTRMSFNQTLAPTGWTKDTTAALNDSILRIVVGTVGSGGSTAFSAFNGQTATAAYTLAIADIPSHTHSYTAPGGSTTTTSKSGPSAGSTAGASTGGQGGGGAHSHGITTAIKYNDFIIASKN